MRVKGEIYFSRKNALIAPVDFPHLLSKVLLLSAFVICFNIFVKMEDQNINQNVSHPWVVVVNDYFLSENLLKAQSLCPSQ